MHSADGFTDDNWKQVPNSIAGRMKVLEAFHKSGGLSSPLLVSSTKHWDQDIHQEAYYQLESRVLEGRPTGYKRYPVQAQA